MDKCILFVRVSTEKQSFDEQEKELYEMAVADGFAPQNIIAICTKESGIKLTEEERAGLTEMKQYVETDNIICVYAWEISRIARKKKILFSILEYLIERKIQLVIKEPFIKLLNPDGKINEASETMFTLFAQLAESEMRNKKARFARGMKEAKELGKIHGLPKYGYFKDNFGRAQINEQEAEFIRKVYNLYLSTELSESKLHKELLSQGYSICLYKLRDILSNEVYIGNKFYPAIVTKEMWQRSKNRTLSNNKRAVKSTRRINFGEKLIICPNCGKFYVAGNTAYRCSANSANKYALREEDRCDFYHCIHISRMDGLLWYIAQNEYAKYMAEDTIEKEKEIDLQLNVLSKKIAVVNNSISKHNEVIERIVESYISGLLSQEKRDLKIAKEKETFKAIVQEKARLQNDIERLISIKTELKDKDYLSKYNLAEAHTNNMSKREMWEIVHKFISWVEIKAVQLDRWVACERKIKKRKCVKIKVHLTFDEPTNIMYEENEEEDWTIYYDGKYQRTPFFVIRNGKQENINIPFIS